MIPGWIPPLEWSEPDGFIQSLYAGELEVPVAQLVRVTKRAWMPRVLLPGAAPLIYAGTRESRLIIAETEVRRWFAALSTALAQEGRRDDSQGQGLLHPLRARREERPALSG